MFPVLARVLRVTFSFDSSFLLDTDCQRHYNLLDSISPLTYLHFCHAWTEGSPVTPALINWTPCAHYTENYAQILLRQEKNWGFHTKMPSSLKVFAENWVWTLKFLLLWKENQTKPCQLIEPLFFSKWQFQFLFAKIPWLLFSPGSLKMIKVRKCIGPERGKNAGLPERNIQFTFIIKQYY